MHYCLSYHDAINHTHSRIQYVTNPASMSNSDVSIMNKFVLLIKSFRLTILFDFYALTLNVESECLSMSFIKKNGINLVTKPTTFVKEVLLTD